MIYRRTLFILTITGMVMCGLVHGQALERSGLQAGVNIANIRGGEWFSGGTHTIGAGLLGGYGVFDIGLPTLIRAELLVIRRGYQLRDTEPTFIGGIPSDPYETIANVRIDYLEAAALAIFQIGKRLGIVAGPYLEYPVQILCWTRLSFPAGTTEEFRAWAIDNAESSEVHSTESLSMDAGIVAGTVRQFGPLEGSVRVNYGLLRSINQDRDFKHYGFQLVVGYSF